MSVWLESEEVSTAPVIVAWDDIASVLSGPCASLVGRAGVPEVAVGLISGVDGV